MECLLINIMLNINSIKDKVIPYNKPFKYPLLSIFLPNIKEDINIVNIDNISIIILFISILNKFKIENNILNIINANILNDKHNKYFFIINHLIDYIR